MFKFLDGLGGGFQGRALGPRSWRGGNLYSEAGFPPLQTTPPFQHRLGVPP